MLMEAEPRWPGLTEAGAVPATIDLAGNRAVDANSLVTGLGLRALRRHAKPSSAELRKRMLDFVELCEVDNPPGAFAFWPIAERPAWAAGIPPDADDTAICISELFLSGRMSRREAIGRTARLLLPSRVRQHGGGPPWIHEGVFLTWLAPTATNIVDCTVNANVLALFALLEMQAPPGHNEAVELIQRGLAWAGDDPVRLRALTPFYPKISEFHGAVAHAVACGCIELETAAERLRELAAREQPEPHAVVCSAAYRQVGWRSPALAAIRLACAVQPILRARLL